MDNLFLAEALSAAEMRSPKLIRAKLPLQPAVQVIYAMRLHTCGRKNLKMLNAVWSLKEDAAIFTDAKGVIESRNVRAVLYT